MKINFNFIEVPELKIKRKEWKKWIASIPEQEQKVLQNLQYIFCNDEYLLQVNIQYLNHDTLTDIITFDNSDEDNVIDGDIFISLERVKENADKFKVTFETELARVLAHGVLHLCGYGDKKSAEIKVMRAKEDFYIASSPAKCKVTSLK